MILPVELGNVKSQLHVRSCRLCTRWMPK